MVLLRPKHKRQRRSQYRDAAARRKSFGFVLGQIDGQHQRNRLDRIGAQDAKTARLDQAAEARRRAGNQVALPQGDVGAVICNKARAKCHKPQRK